MIYQRIVFCFLMALSMVSIAETERVEKTTTGYGQTYQEALAGALYDAVRQVRGATVGSEKQLRADLNSVFNQNAALITSTVGVEENIFAVSKGWVESYEVKSTTKPKSKEDMWEVTVVAMIPVHQSQIKDQGRQRIAVMPFRFAHSTFAIDDLGNASSAFQISSRIRDRILGSLTQTQQFVVVNRDHGAEFASEKALLSSDNVSPSEASRIGNVAGADFMVVGNIHDLSTKAESKTFYGMTKTTFQDRIDLSYQVIEVATQKVLWADTVNTKVERKPADDDSGITTTIDHVAHLVLSGVMDVLYPIKIMDVASANEIYLSQGKARVREGDVFALFSEGRTLKQPDSGIEIKIDGKKVAELVAVTVLPKYSIAEVRNGSIDGVKAGDIVRTLVQDKEDLYKNKEVRSTPGSSDAPVNW
ncbi:MAG: hypothetical protein C9356_06840 [Oleiphilus sp.]|nr:MAG: hypothetical protein C9356_06840 [Oleiphilus sp.]